jgi:hypothetical protein
MNRTDKQILRSRAFERKKRRTDGFSSFSFRAASEAVILSAEGAKDLLLGIVND